MILNYIFPDGHVVIATKMNPDMEHFDTWLDSMIKQNPDTIFFYTIPTTDIF